MSDLKVTHQSNRVDPDGGSDKRPPKVGDVKGNQIYTSQGWFTFDEGVTVYGKNERIPFDFHFRNPAPIDAVRYVVNVPTGPISQEKRKGILFFYEGLGRFGHVRPSEGTAEGHYYYIEDQPEFLNPLVKRFYNLFPDINKKEIERKNWSIHEQKHLPDTLKEEWKWSGEMVNERDNSKYWYQYYRLINENGDTSKSYQHKLKVQVNKPVN